ncbi:MAG: ComF family protein [Zetaproteobacteria bacterium]|nr:MAG: ComF family protein [Zetaproteobacteria bacterium]
MCVMLMAMESLSTFIGQAVYRVRHLLFPPRCVFCQIPLPERDGCCADCLMGIRIWPRSHCRRCGAVLSEALAPGPCGNCLRRPPPFDRSESLFCYEGPVREAILQWKLGGHPAAIHWLLDAATAHIRDVLGPEDLLLPIPMPLARMRRVGQHHAADLARWLARRGGCGWNWRILRRVGCQRRQSELSGRERQRNLRGAFALDWQSWDALHQRPARIWLVDDIQTTGATMREAARVAARLGKPLGTLSLARA